MKTLSIIIPIYNEEKTISKILDKVSKLKLEVKKEILIVNDGSTDNSKKIIEKYLNRKKKIRNQKFKFISKSNAGKGSAIRKGIELCTGDIIIIQDADLEYNPKDYGKLIKPILQGREKVVYGSRFLKRHKPRYRIYFWGNKFLSLLTKILYGAKITDMETCYKMISKDIIKDLDLISNGFEIEPEITSKILKKGYKILEIPISYHSRSFEEGKKINWKDGIKAIFILLYWRFKRK